MCKREVAGWLVLLEVSSQVTTPQYSNAQAVEEPLRWSSVAGVPFCSRTGTVRGLSTQLDGEIRHRVHRPLTIPTCLAFLQ
jgi:hypothetical protein